MTQKKRPSPAPQILIVEDDLEIADLIAVLLQNRGFLVKKVIRGEDALAFCQQRIPDLILLDLMLPGINGIDFLKTLRDATRTREIPVIILTAREERKMRIEGFGLGIVDYITKPFDNDILIVRVESALRSHQRLNPNHPASGLPGERRVREELTQLIDSEEGTLIEIKINHLEALKLHDAYSFHTFNEVTKFVADLLREMTAQVGTDSDFIGHTRDDTFLLITQVPNPSEMVAWIHSRFNSQISNFYDFADKEQGFITLPDGSSSPLMALEVSTVSGKFLKDIGIDRLLDMS
jgi:DNA-binding response OmpR family regulator